MIFAELTRPWSIESLLVYSLAPHPMTFAEAFGELKHVEECFSLRTTQIPGDRVLQ
jgi:hypothetical protein